MTDPIPDLQALIDAVHQANTNPGSHLHGEGHWKCVAWTGLQLARQVPDADPLAVFLFGLLHDAQRRSDGRDADHGRRAAELVQRLQGRFYDLRTAQLERLILACHGHVDGQTCADPTIGVCWDADRLNLWRVGMCPDPLYLSTLPAKDPARIAAAARFPGQHLPWSSLYAQVAAPAFPAAPSPLAPGEGV